MKVKILILGLLMIFFAGCSLVRYNAAFAPESTIQKVLDHRVAIATYYEMSEQEYFQIANQTKQVRNYQDVPIFIEHNKETQFVTVAYLGVENPTYYQMPKEEYLNLMTAIKPVKNYQDLQNIPIFIKKDDKTRLVTVAYLGAGAIIKNNHILTVNHLFNQERYYDFMSVWVFKEGIGHPIKAKLIVRTECELISEGVHFYDYAIIKMEEDLGLPGLKIAKPDSLKMGDKVIFTGSTGGFAFFTRFGYATKLQNYLQRDIAGKLGLSSFEKFPFWTVYPGGSGDSGGFVVDTNGEIVTVMYCGLTNNSEMYIFGNPTQIIWDFLKEYNLEHLAR